MALTRSSGRYPAAPPWRTGRGRHKHTMALTRRRGRALHKRTAVPTRVPRAPRCKGAWSERLPDMHRTHSHTHTHAYAHTFSDTHTHVHTHTCTHTRTHKHTHTHAHTYSAEAVRRAAQAADVPDPVGADFCPSLHTLYSEPRFRVAAEREEVCE
jgi:hypothetical protein